MAFGERVNLNNWSLSPLSPLLVFLSNARSDSGCEMKCTLKVSRVRQEDLDVPLWFCLCLSHRFSIKKKKKKCVTANNQSRGETGKEQKKKKKKKKKKNQERGAQQRRNRCLPEVTQWLYGFSLRLGWAVVHLVHLFSKPARLGKLWERMSCAVCQENTSVPSPWLWFNKHTVYLFAGE